VIPPYTAAPCPAAPNDTTPQAYPAECQVGQAQGPVCYSYGFDFDEGKPGFRYGGSINFEIECSTQFQGTQMGPASSPGKNIDLRDCIRFCDEENRLRPNQPPVCIGVTFLDEFLVPDGSNCYKYSSLSCATRGLNSSYQSARLLYDRYPAMVDYDSSFNC
jgi:hypothetical protein